MPLKAQLQSAYQQALDSAQQNQNLTASLILENALNPYFESDELQEHNDVEIANLIAEMMILNLQNLSLACHLYIDELIQRIEFTIKYTQSLAKKDYLDAVIALQTELSQHETLFQYNLAQSYNATFQQHQKNINFENNDFSAEDPEVENVIGTGTLEISSDIVSVRSTSSHSQFPIEPESKEETPHIVSQSPSTRANKPTTRSDQRIYIPDPDRYDKNKIDKMPELLNRETHPANPAEDKSVRIDYNDNNLNLHTHTLFAENFDKSNSGSKRLQTLRQLVTQLIEKITDKSLSRTEFEDRFLILDFLRHINLYPAQNDNHTAADETNPKLAILDLAHRIRQSTEANLKTDLLSNLKTLAQQLELVKTTRSRPSSRTASNSNSSMPQQPASPSPSPSDPAGRVTPVNNLQSPRHLLKRKM